MNGITTEWSLFWILGCIALAFILSFLLYSKRLSTSFKSTRSILFALRFLTIFLLSFFLLKPFINSQSVLKEQPIVTIGIDNSSSIVEHSNSSFTTDDFNNNINSLIEELSEDFDVEPYTFGEQIKRGGDVNFSDRLTDFSAYFNEISDLYSNRNVVANIVVSDGIYNSSSNPLYANYSFDAPLYTVLLGDTSKKRDVELSTVSYNELAYLGNTFPLKVSVLAQNCLDENLSVSVWENDVKIKEEQVKVNSTNAQYYFDFYMDAKKIGVQKYTIKVNPLDNEKNTFNNQKNIYIDVLKSKQKILLLSDITHPDISALSNAIESNKNYRLIVESIDDFDGNYQAYSLVIAFQTTIPETDLPVFYFLGNSITSIQTDWFSYESKNSLNEVIAIYTPFSLFSLDEKWNDFLQQLPPLYSPLSALEFYSEHSSLFSQSVLGIETEKPIISFYKQNGQRNALCTVEGLWKWRLFEFMKTKDHKLFNELINKSIQFLAVKDDKRSFRLRYDKLIFENEPLFIEADFYNSNFELITSPEVSITITNENGADFPYTFNKLDNNYFLELEQLDVGNYTFTSTVNHDGKEYLNKGQFSVLELEVEKMNSRANHQLLYSLSKKYNGKSFYLSELNALKSELNKIESSVLSYITKSQIDLINLRWISILLFVFLVTEWFVRKRNTNI
jgi:hypothetical protein